jgi:transposase
LNDDTSVLFGLPGVRVQRVDLDEHGGRVVHVETAAGTSAPGCARLSFTESIEQVPAGWRTTGRLRTAMGAAIGDVARSVSEVATAFAISWPTAHAAFVEHADALLVVAAPTTVLGIDETRRGKPRWVRDSPQQRWRRVDPYDTGFVDIAGDQGLLGQREGRTSQSVVEWLEEQSQQFRDAILFVAIDPAAVYAKASARPGCCPMPDWSWITSIW